MIPIYYLIIDWSEVWAPIIPVVVALRYRQQPTYMIPVVIYLWLAIGVSLLVDISWYYREEVPPWLQSNNYLYNIHSVIKLICLSVFFMLLKDNFFKRGRLLLFALTLALVLVNFVVAEDFFRYDSFSSRLFAFESGLILFYSLQYFIYRLVKNDTLHNRRPEFWVVVGLSIYVIFNFPYFLFYTTLISANQEFVAYAWNFHNITYITLCVFLAKALYAPGYK